VVVLSDGILGDQEETMDTLASSLGDARLLVVAVGADADRATVQRLAELGRGESVVVERAADIVRALQELLGSFASPVAWDIDVDWGGANVVQVVPSPIPDLYAARPLTLRAIVEGEPPSTVTVHGSTTDGQDTFSEVISVR
jgi:Ca-activated chloride channel family protein